MVEKAQSHGRVDRAARTGQPGSAVSPGEAGGRAERREGQSGGEDAVREDQTCRGRGGAGRASGRPTDSFRDRDRDGSGPRLLACLRANPDSVTLCSAPLLQDQAVVLEAQQGGEQVFAPNAEPSAHLWPLWPREVGLKPVNPKYVGQKSPQKGDKWPAGEAAQAEPKVASRQGRQRKGEVSWGRGPTLRPAKHPPPPWSRSLSRKEPGEGRPAEPGRRERPWGVGEARGEAPCSPDLSRAHLP